MENENEDSHKMKRNDVGMRITDPEGLLSDLDRKWQLGTAEMPAWKGCV